jgi:hypothetical protein
LRAEVERTGVDHNLAISKKKYARERAADEAVGRKKQAAIRKLLQALRGELYKDRPDFLKVLDDAMKRQFGRCVTAEGGDTSNVKWVLGIAEEVAAQREAGPEIDFPTSPAASRTRRARNASSSTDVELKDAKYKTPLPPSNVARR